jgi:ParB/RepB/Spo0J family partition protein
VSARTGSLASLRAGIRSTVGGLGETARREAARTEAFERGERANWATLPHDRILPDPEQPRKFFDEVKLRAMAESIRAVGLREPLRVYPAGYEGRYRILDGQRRWHAIDALLDEGLEEFREVIVLIEDVPESTERLRVEQLVTSLHKEVFVPLETAAALLEIAERGGEDGAPLTAVALAERHGFNTKHVERHLKVARGLSDEERGLVLEQYPAAPLDPLEKLVAWLNGPAGATLDAAGRLRAVEAFAREKPAARALDTVLRPYAAKKPAGRPAKLHFRCGPTAGGGFSVNLRIPAGRAADAAALDRAEQDLEKALAELRRFRASRK